jgi:hypothetical protein
MDLGRKYGELISGYSVVSMTPIINTLSTKDVVIARFLCKT